MADDSAINEQPKAFIIMPFGDSESDAAKYQAIYTHFKHRLLEHGFNAMRADDMPGSQNILQDILRAIDECDLVIAELTSNNPNVLFELAIAYSLDKAVILLTQGDIGQLPFDLKSYRVVQYSTDFDKMMLAEEALKLGTRACVGGDRAFFGNPVSEYFDRPIQMFLDIDEESAEFGLYDYFEQIEDGSKSITVIIGELNEGQQQVTQTMKAATKKISNLQETRPRMRVMRQVAVDMESYASLIDGKISTYADVLDQQEIAVESVIREINLDDERNREAYAELIDTYDNMVEQIEFTHSAMQGYISSLKATPSVERRFNRARSHLIGSLAILLKEFNRHQDIIDRVIQIGKDRLGSVDA